MYLLFMIFSFFPLNNDSEVNKEADEIHEVIKSADNRCLDKVMTKWFNMFTDAQEMGYNMNEADDVAIEKLPDQCE